MKIFEKLLDTEKLSKEISQKEYSKYFQSICFIINTKCNLGCIEGVTEQCNTPLNISLEFFEKIISQLPKSSLFIDGTNISNYLKIAEKYHIVSTRSKTSKHKTKIECFKNLKEESNPHEVILILPNLRIKDNMEDIGYIDNTGRLIYTNGHRNKF